MAIEERDEEGRHEEAGHEEARLALDEDDRLPWLESADDDYDEGGVDTGRIIAFILAAMALLAVIVGGIWWYSHRKADPSLTADGSTIPAPAQPYKEAPKDAGGKTFQGTGDTSYAVAQGQDGKAHLTGGGEAPKPSVDGVSPSAHPPASTPPAPTAAPIPASGGVGVQVGAYGSQEKAEAGWAALAGRNEALKGVKHRVVEGSADIGKVYRLQAIAGDEASASALCSKLKASGVPCQVKR